MRLYNDVLQESHLVCGDHRKHLNNNIHALVLFLEAVPADFLVVFFKIVVQPVLKRSEVVQQRLDAHLPAACQLF